MPTVVPGEKPLKGGHIDRPDLPSQPFDGQPVNPRQQSSVAPLGLRLAVRAVLGRSEASAEDRALALERFECRRCL